MPFNFLDSYLLYTRSLLAPLALRRSQRAPVTRRDWGPGAGLELGDSTGSTSASSGCQLLTVICGEDELQVEVSESATAGEAT